MTFNPQPKETPYRCRRMLDLAPKAPICFHCGKPNDGTVVGAHINALWAGKGTGTKSHDLVAFLCSICHADFDGEQKWVDDYEFLKSVYKSTVWLLKEGYLIVKSNP